jgi:hypothetical protein
VEQWAGGGTGALDGCGIRETGSTASCDLAIFGTARLRNEADVVVGHPRADGVAWPAGPACTPAGACTSGATSA